MNEEVPSSRDGRAKGSRKTPPGIDTARRTGGEDRWTTAKVRRRAAVGRGECTSLDRGVSSIIASNTFCRGTFAHFDGQGGSCEPCTSHGRRRAKRSAPSGETGRNLEIGLPRIPAHHIIRSAAGPTIRDDLIRARTRSATGARAAAVGDRVRHFSRNTTNSLLKPRGLLLPVTRAAGRALGTPKFGSEREARHL